MNEDDDKGDADNDDEDSGVDNDGDDEDSDIDNDDEKNGDVALVRRYTIQVCYVRNPSVTSDDDDDDDDDNDVDDGLDP